MVMVPPSGSFSKAYPPLVTAEARGWVRTRPFQGEQRKVWIYDLNTLPPLPHSSWRSKGYRELHGVCTSYTWYPRGDRQPWNFFAFQTVSLRPLPPIQEVSKAIAACEPDTDRIVEIAGHSFDAQHQRGELTNITIYTTDLHSRDFNCPEDSALLNKTLRVGLTSHHTRFLPFDPKTTDHPGMILVFIRPWWIP